MVSFLLLNEKGKRPIVVSEHFVHKKIATRSATIFRFFNVGFKKSVF
jgi:hypothetical protein